VISVTKFTGTVASDDTETVSAKVAAAAVDEAAANSTQKFHHNSKVISLFDPSVQQTSHYCSLCCIIV